MASVLDYSTTAGSNTTVGGVNIAEGMQAGLANNGMRAMMADSKKWQLDWSGIVTAGTSNAYTITSNQGISAYADGLRFTFRADRNNTGAATLNVDSRGAKALRKVTGGALAAVAADDIVAEAIYDVVYDVTSDVFVIVGFSGLQASAFMQTVLDDADGPAVLATIGAQASDADLTALAALASTGIAVRTAADTWAQRQIVSADGSVTITNPAGVAGNVDLSVANPVAWALVATGALSGATVDITTGLTGHEEVMIVVEGAIVSASNIHEIRVGDSGGFLTTSIYEAYNGSQTFIRTSDGVGSARSYNLTISRWSATTGVKGVAGTLYASSFPPVAILTAVALDRIRFLTGGGTYTAGTYYIYAR